MQEFGIMDPHQILYKFAVYAFEVKNEHKFECGFVSFNEVPLHCQIAFMVTLADGGKVIFEKNCLLKSFLGCHYLHFFFVASLPVTSRGAGPGIALLQQRKLQRAQLQKTCQLLKIVPQMVLLRATTTMKMMTALMTLSPEQDQVITCIVFFLFFR